MPVYDVRVEISYDYTAPARSSRTLLRLLPRWTAGQDVLNGHVAADPPPGTQAQATDFFGNLLTEMVHDQPLDQITFRFGGRVRRSSEATGLDLSTELDALAGDIAAVAALGPDAPHHFTAPSRRAMPDPAITAFVKDAIGGQSSTLGVVRAAAAAIHATMAFDPTATDVTTEPATAFAARSGVCQDFSHILIAGLRAIGVPAGYVSGFLRTLPPPGQKRLDGADAMHAWVRAWCGLRAGWIEIDPTNAVAAGADHITVAYGRDYADVAPVKGILRSAGAHTTDQAVDVIEVPSATGVAP
ncbi:MAG: transglutaminase family protein [Pseudomonadota bacterium]